MFGFIKGDDNKQAQEGPYVSSFPAPIERTRLGAWWDSRKAVNSEVYLDDYLRQRLRIYCAQWPQHRYPLPVDVEICAGELEVEPRGDQRHPLEERFDKALEEVEANQNEARVQRALRVVGAINRNRAERLEAGLCEARVELEDVETDLDEVANLVHACEEDLQEQVVEGEAACTSTEARAEAERGRPELGFPWIILGQVSFIAVVLAAEAYLFAQSFWNYTGVDTSDLWRSWQFQPMSVLSGVGFSVGVMGTLFIFWSSLLHTKDNLMERGATEESWWKPAARGGFGVLLFVTLSVFSWYVAGLRESVGEASQILTASMAGAETGASGGHVMAFFLLTFLVPLACGMLERRILARAAERADVEDEQRRWDMQRNTRLEARERFEEQIDYLRSRRDELEQKRDELERRIEAIKERAVGLEDQLRERFRTLRHHANAFANSLVAALGRDRLAYLERQPAPELVGAHPRRRVAEKNSRDETALPLPEVDRPVPRPNGANGTASDVLFVPDGFESSAEEASHAD